MFKYLASALTHPQKTDIPNQSCDSKSMLKTKAKSLWFRPRSVATSQTKQNPPTDHRNTGIPLHNFINCKYTTVIMGIIIRLFNKVSGEERGIHTATLPHREAHTSEGEQGLTPALTFVSLDGWGSPVWTRDSRSTTVRALTLTLILFPQFSWGSYPPPPPQEPHFLPPKFCQQIICVIY